MSNRPGGGFGGPEASFGGSQTITVGTVLQGIGFSGLVTFTSATAQLQQISNGSQSLSFGEQGTTTIDGGKITTGTIDAARLNVGQINVTQTNNYSTIQQGIQGAAAQGRPLDAEDRQHLRSSSRPCRRRRSRRGGSPGGLAARPRAPPRSA